MAAHHDHGHDGHDHGHDGHNHGAGHSHVVAAGADRRWLTLALVLIAGFMAIEVVAGLLAGSLALLSDAAHMLTDAGSIGLALVAARFAARPATGAYTFGFGRAEILSAQINGAALFVLAGVIAVEAVRRLGSPPDVDGSVVVLVGGVGALVNVAAFWALSRSQRQSLNIAGARAHVLADLYGSVAAITAGAVIAFGGPTGVDALAALTVAALMLRSGWLLLRASTRVLLEASPRGIDPTRSAARSPRCRGLSRSTTCTSGRSPRASSPSRHTSSSRPTTTPPAPPRAAVRPPEQFAIRRTTPGRPRVLATTHADLASIGSVGRFVRCACCAARR